MSDFFCNKDTVAAAPKKNFAVYSNENFNGEDGSLKSGILNQEAESRNGVRNQISVIEKYKKNSLTLKCTKQG